jgi:hypothetical protein
LRQAASEIHRRRARDRRSHELRLKATVSRLVAGPGGPSTEQAAPPAIEAFRVPVISTPDQVLHPPSPSVVGHSDHGGPHMPFYTFL